MIYKAADFGALGDGLHNDTLALQAAVDACHENGGGRVLLEGGHTYRCGTLELRSCVELHLEMGAVLKASDDLEDFNRLGKGAVSTAKVTAPTYTNCDYSGGPTLFFLYAKDCQHISITGFGRIDGNQEIFYGTVTPWHIDGSFYPRVPLLFLEHVEHLTLHQVTLTNSGFWTTHLVGCEDVLIDGIRILNDLRLANCDGIDPDHCKNVRIANCHIESADDCIVFKNTEHAAQYGACENIVVSNCTLTSTSAAVKFGTESVSPFRNISIQNCVISRSNRGISLQLRDAGYMENIHFSNLSIDTRQFSPDHWWGKAEPIAITALRRREETKIGSVNNITFENIDCIGENGILICGEPERNISNISFRNITVRLEKRTDWPKGIRDLRPCADSGLTNGTVHCFSAHNAKDITLDRLRVTVDKSMSEYVTEEMEIINCERLMADGQTL
ncbi:MAG: glycosyl hydrolase family 28 protein [Eubacterium sp.]|nr:glycosyl hydrolase family 28 protein [Eubacterium sp.]